MALRLWFSGKPLQRPGGAGASTMREGSTFGAYMTDDLLLYLLGQICELKAGRRSRLGDRVRRHGAKLARFGQKSAARSGLILRRGDIRLSAAGLVWHLGSNAVCAGRHATMGWLQMMMMMQLLFSGKHVETVNGKGLL